MKRAALATLSLAAVLGWARGALAEGADWDGDYGVKSERRSDFTLGASYGALLASTYGYPNEAGKIDDDRYVADTGLGVGTQYSVWLGGALRDWFTFGLGVNSSSYSANDLDASSTGFIFRIETFPLWAQGDPWRDAGMYASFGIGGMTLERGGDKVADGGAISIIGIGAFYEPVRFSIFSFGPTAEYTLQYSRTIHMYGASLGARLVLYTGP